MAIDALCIGHAAFDTSLFVEGFPRENEKYEIHELLSGSGGPAANAACLLGRWGVSCAFAGVLGDDGYGRQILVEFRNSNVHASLVELRAGHATPVSTIVVNIHGGSRTIINFKKPTEPLKLPANALADLAPRVLLADGHELQAARTALEALPDAFSILDAGSVREGTMALAGRVDALIVSERFARQAANFTELQTEADLRACVNRLQDQFAPQVVAITLGERGLVADWGTGFRLLPAPAVAAVDTTGAGDILHGAVAYGVLQRWPWEAILRFAVRAATLSVTRRGGSHAIPHLAEVQAYV